MSNADVQTPNVSAIIVNYDGGELLLDCLATLESQRRLLETIVVENGSTDGSTAAAVARFPSIKVVREKRNIGYAGGANAGAHVARGDLLLFLDPDVRLSDGCLDGLAAQFGDPNVGVAGPPLDVASSGAVEWGYTVDLIGSPVGLRKRRAPLYAAGCSLMTRATLFRELGGHDDRFFTFVEDVDYCWRVLLRGLDVRIADVRPVWHKGGGSTPGGYASSEGFSSSRLRIALRERNTLATLLKCYGGPLASLIVPIYVLQSLATAALLAACGNRQTGRAIVGGLRWNARELPRTLALRRQIQASRQISDRAILRRMHPGISKLSLLIRFGLPRVSDGESFPIETGL